jgi:hypothetical protein
MYLARKRNNLNPYAMKKRLFFIVGSLCSLVAWAQSYNVSAIPAAMKKNASVAVHLDNTVVEVSDIDKATVKIQKIFTVLDEEGKDELMFTQYVNKYIALDEAEIKVYDQNGKQISRYKKKEMSTVAVGEGLIEDGYMTYYRIPATSYPVTVEFNYQLKLKSLMYIPSFRFIGSRESVAESNYTIKFPASINIRYKPKLTDITPQATDDGKYKIYKWTVKDLPALAYEPGSVSSRDRYPYVNIVADQFTYYGSEGDLSSWKNFGSWINHLY